MSAPPAHLEPRLRVVLRSPSTYEKTLVLWLRGRKRVALGDTKNKKSRRTVRLTPQAAEALRVHLERQLGEIATLGDLYNDQGLVFTSEAGTPINPSNLRQRSFLPLLKKTGLPHIRFHDLRHTCATLLLSKGVHPKFVQELLGHATIAITLDTYSHVMPGMGDQTALAMQDALSPIDEAIFVADISGKRGGRCETARGPIPD